VRRRCRVAALCTCLALASLSACKPSTIGSSAVVARTVTERVRVGAVSLETVQLGATDGSIRVVLHGGPGLDHNYLRPSLDALATSRARLVYVDLRGHGRSDAPPDAGGYTLSAASADLSMLATRLSPRAPIDVIAHDFGAAVALEFAAAHPDQVRRLVLIAPVRDGVQIRSIGVRTREVLGESGANALRALTTPQGTLRDPRQLSQLFRTLGSLWWASPPSAATLETITRSVRYRPSADEHFLVQLLNWDGRRVARDVRASTLVLSGAQDRTFLPSESREIADTVAHGRFVEIEGAGHLPFVEKPTEVAQAIESFLR